MTPKTSRRHLDAAEIEDLTEKGWRVMSLTLCFAIVSALFLVGEPDKTDGAELALATVDW